MKFVTSTDRSTTHVVSHFEQTITAICCDIALAVPVPDEQWPAINDKSPNTIKNMFPTIVAAWNAMAFGKLLPMTIGKTGPEVDGYRVKIEVLARPKEFTTMRMAALLGEAG